MRLVCSIGAIFIAGSGAAMDIPDCTLTPGAMESCSPIVACMPGEGVYLVGQAVGWGQGTLSGITNEGVLCKGDWRILENLGTGLARFTCEDGMAGALVYTYQDPETGTATAAGLISGFGRLEAWSGENIRQFLDASGRSVDGALMCGATPMLLGARLPGAMPGQGHA